MIFHTVSLKEARDAILVHSLSLGDRTLKKGMILEADTLALLAAAGIDQVTVARLEAGDIPENDAAAALVHAASGPMTRTGTAFTGRANLFSETAGLAIIDPNRVTALNRVDERMTLATVNPYDRVRAGQMVATVKVIPFACPRTVVDETARLARHPAPLVTVRPFRNHAVALITTAHGENAVPDGKLRRITENRLTLLGGHIAHEQHIPHDSAAVATALTGAARGGCTLILVSGASAIVDRRDVIPAGIEAAGGRLIHFGMPVDPGNLLLLAALDRCAVVGLPGCARSPKLNGFDWILERLMADVDISSEDIMAMGAGGLLKEIPSRPQPRRDPDRRRALKATSPSPPRRIAALVLAAGQSRRMGAVNKLLVPVPGLPGARPMVRYVVDAALASRARPVIVVTGHDAPAVTKALNSPDVTIVHNPGHRHGLSASLKTGIRALPKDTAGVIVCLGDMPLITPAHLDYLINQFDPAEGRAICVPVVRGRRGNPVLWSAQFFPEILSLSGDQGARRLLDIHSRDVWEVAFEDDAPLADVDTEETLGMLAKNLTNKVIKNP